MSRLQKFQLLTAAELAHSPSRADGVPESMENRRRRLAAQHMKDVSAKFHMGVSTWAIAVTFFNRFYARKSMKKNNTFLVACASLYLASKVESKAKPHQKLANELAKAWYGKDNPQLQALAAQSQRQQAAATRQASSGVVLPPPPADFYSTMHAAVLEAERALLYTVGFDFNVDIIHTHMARFVNRPSMKTIELHKNLYFQQKIISLANDIYSKDGNLVLQYPMDKIAIACAYFIFKFAKSGKMAEIPPPPPPGPDGMPWYVQEGLSVQECMEITNRFTERLYVNPAAVPEKRKAPAMPAPSVTAGAASTAMLGACESAAYSGGGPTPGGDGGPSDAGEMTSVARPLSSDMGSASMAASKRAAPSPIASPPAMEAAASEAANGHPMKRARVAESTVVAANETISTAKQPPPSRLPTHSPLESVAEFAGSAPTPPAASAPAAGGDSEKEEGELEEGELQ